MGELRYPSRVAGSDLWFHSWDIDVLTDVLNASGDCVALNKSMLVLKPFDRVLSADFVLQSRHGMLGAGEVHDNAGQGERTDLPAGTGTAGRAVPASGLDVGSRATRLVMLAIAANLWLIDDNVPGCNKLCRYPIALHALQC